MKTRFSLRELRSEHGGASKPYLEFLRVPSMSSGVYRLPAGGVDRQSPHTEDEIYLVISGRARFMHEGVDGPVAAGDVLFVPAGDDHRFHQIEEDLEVVVVFAPAEGEALSAEMDDPDAEGGHLRLVPKKKHRPAS